MSWRNIPRTPKTQPCLPQNDLVLRRQVSERAKMHMRPELQTKGSRALRLGLLNMTHDLFINIQTDLSAQGKVYISLVTLSV
jgi:hypothetical protein